MRKIIQTKKGYEGNCLETCLACIFDLKVSEVPDFNEYNDKSWIYKLSEWLYRNFGLTCLCISFDSDEEESIKLVKGYHIIVCKGYVANTHAIVSKDGRPYYDPMGKLQEKYENITHLIFISARTTYSF